MCLSHPRRCALQWQDQPCSRPSCSSSPPRRLPWPLILPPVRWPQGPTFGGDQRAKGPGTFQVRRTHEPHLAGWRKFLFAALPTWPKAGDTQGVRVKDSSAISGQRVPLESLFREPNACTCRDQWDTCGYQWDLPLVPTIWCSHPQQRVPQGAPACRTWVPRASTTRSPSQ